MAEKCTSIHKHLHLFFQVIPVVAGVQPHVCPQSPPCLAAGIQGMVQDRAKPNGVVNSKLKPSFGFTSTFILNQQEDPATTVEKPLMSGRKHTLKIQRNNFGLNNTSSL